MRPKRDAHLKYTDDDRVNQGEGKWLFVNVHIPPTGWKKKIIAGMYQELRLPNFFKDENGDMQMEIGDGPKVLQGLLLNGVTLIFR